VGALRAQATAALRGEEADPTRERQTAEQGEGPRVEAGARERDAPDAAADTADADAVDVIVVIAVEAVVVTAADAADVDVAPERKFCSWLHAAFASRPAFCWIRHAWLPALPPEPASAS